MTVIINEFEIDVEAPAEEDARTDNAPPTGPAPMTLRDVLEQMDDRDQRLSAW